MKRFYGDVVGGQKPAGGVRDVAGLATPSRSRDVASFRHALNDPMGTAVADEEWLSEFEEFMSDDLSLSSGASTTPDPAFQERLRRQLWRTQLLTRRGEGGEPH